VLEFILNSDELIVDTNEDGFNTANVVSICSTGRSSKKQDQNDESIGEKGYGFKSVFNIADRVHIQSGLWSFRFEHNKDDPLSMVRPIHTKELPLPENVKTRIRLRYERKHLAALISELESIPNTTISFLKKIKKLTVSFNGVESSISSKEICRTSDTESPLLLLGTTITCKSGKREKTEERYRLFSRSASAMPPDYRRAKGIQPEIVLGFPVDTTGKPCISGRGQHIFSFLPMSRQSQLPVSNM
jgi:hypothetical protein